MKYQIPRHVESELGKFVTVRLLQHCGRQSTLDLPVPSVWVRSQYFALAHLSPFARQTDFFRAFSRHKSAILNPAISRNGCSADLLS